MSNTTPKGTDMITITERILNRDGGTIATCEYTAFSADQIVDKIRDIRQRNNAIGLIEGTTYVIELDA